MDKRQFEKLHMQHMNSQQREAVFAAHGAVLLLAVPGSGKTTVLVTRLGYMILCCGIEPENILTMTYTVAATEEMRSRFAARFGETYRERMEIRTINGVSSKIIRYYSENISNKAPFDLEDNEGRLIGMIKQVYTEFYSDYPDDSTVRDIKSRITYAKNMQLTKAEIEALDTGVKYFPQIFERYNAVLREKRLMDYDDQMDYALKILRQCPEVLEHFREQYRFICVDESQDTSKIQHAIIKLLAEGRGNIFMVGDEDQSIYGFRAAYPEALLKFEKDYPNARLLLMEQNYRSTPEIVSAADSFIQSSKNRREKHMFTERGHGIPVQRIYAVGRETQYRYLFEVAKNCKSETAVLYRNNDSALPLIDLFEREGISYNCRRFDETFFSHKIIGDICDIIDFSFDGGNSEIFMRIYYKLGCPISKQAALFACREAKRSGKPLLEAVLGYAELSDFARERIAERTAQFKSLQSDNAVTAVKRIMQGLHYGDYIEQNKLDSGKIDILLMLAEREKSAKSLKNRLFELKSIIANHENRSDVSLVLSTVHSAKGLEFERVYLLDVIDGILPSRPLSRMQGEEDFAQYEEERRLFYVAMTRAMRELYIFCLRMPSEFISELCAKTGGAAPRNCAGENCTHGEIQGRIAAQCGETVLFAANGGMKFLPLREVTTESQYRELKMKSISHTGVTLSVGDRIRHKTLGVGTVKDIQGDFITAEFAAGEKRMLLSALVQNRLIEKL